MMTDINIWPMKVKKYRYIEILSFVLVILLAIGGVVFDLFSINLGLFVVDFADVSLTALQIQASLSGISIAIVALLSGFISESAYGVTISDYYTNIRPIVFKQKIVISILLLFSALGLGFHLIRFYNAVIALTWGTILIIIVSVVEVYSIFSGGYRTTCEIKEYVGYILSDVNVKYSKKETVFSGFINEWANIKQNTVSYEQYLTMYSNAVLSMMSLDSERTIEMLNNHVTTLIKNQTANLDTEDLYRLYRVLEVTYSMILKYISENKVAHINSRVTIYEDSDYEILNAMLDMPIESLNDYVRWEYLIDKIIKVNIYCSNNESRQPRFPTQSELKRINWIATCLGEALARRRKAGEIVSVREWEFKRDGYYCYGIPKQFENELKLNQCKSAFSFFYSLLRYGLADIAATAAKELYYADIEYEHILFNCLIFCYTYYISERESLLCVTEEEKQNANSLLEKWKKEDLIINCLHEGAWQISENDITRLYLDFNSIMDDYERMPIDGDAKTCIVNDVANDFFIFFLSFELGVNRTIELDSLMSDKNVKRFYHTNFGNSYEKTEQRIISIFDALIGGDDNVKSTLLNGLEIFSRRILNRYKETLISESRFDHERFVQNQEEVCQQIAMSVQNILEEDIDDWCINPEFDESDYRIVLWRCTVPTSLFNASILDYVKTNIETNFLLRIVDILVKAGKIGIYENCEDIKQYTDFIDREDIFYLIGSDYSINTISFKNRRTFDEFVLNRGIKRIAFGRGPVGLLLAKESLPLQIKSVSVSLSPVEIEDISSEMNENGMYVSSEYGDGKIEFTKEEFQKFIADEKTIINVSAKVNLKMCENVRGYKIIRKEK